MPAERPCIVIVEDNQDMLTIIRDVLEMEGFDPIGFTHPFTIEALSLDPALFLFDIILPEESGIELAHRLREYGHPETPMIAMSVSPIMIDQARRSGFFDAWLFKPFDLDELLHTVEQQLAA